jgi:uncharacterized membrane-anchored protein YitT (DUF2179 family)
MKKPTLGRTGSLAWNLFLITSGAVLFSIGVKCIAMPMEFISGGIFGTGMLIYYGSGLLSPSFWYLLLNIPLFVMGWIFLSRRFFLYTLYGFIITTLASQLITYQYYFSDPIVAAVAAGSLCGAGSGLIIRSRGSDGGTTIIAIILHQKYNLQMGQVSFGYNLLLFSLGFAVLDPNKIMYSLILVFLTSTIMDYFASLFNNRKMALVVSDKYVDIAQDIMKKMGRGVTYIPGTGAFSGKEKFVIMTVVQNYQVKKLEEIVFKYDPEAFVIIENTFNVLGRGFSGRKIY